MRAPTRQEIGALLGIMLVGRLLGPYVPDCAAAAVAVAALALTIFPSLFGGER